MIRQTPLCICRGHEGAVEAVVWSPQGTYLASGGWDKTVQVWHAEKGDKVTSYQGHTSWIRHGLTWSPDGTLIASGGWDKTVQVWQALSGAHVLTYAGHAGIVVVVAWSP